MISVLILTCNEEDNLPACLRSVGWSDDVLVFDSFSTDRTTEIANAAGVRVAQRAFDNYGRQREAARVEGNFKYPWVLALDADERPEPELVAEMRALATGNNCSHVAFRMRRKDHFMGRWIRHSTLYPSWFVRFFQPAKVRYEDRSVHEYPSVEGSIGALQGHLIHYNFSKGLGQWFERHNRYSDLEAVENLKNLETQRVDWGALLQSADPVARRRALKSLSFRLPFRPTLRFLYMYLVRFGFLDGTPGYHYCRLLAIYEYTIVLKMREIRRRHQQLPI